MAIDYIKLDAFRGATKEVKISFDSAKKITMIFGENGTGKSTIIDGFTFVCNQEKGSLDDHSGTSDCNLLVSEGRDRDHLAVELKMAATSTPWVARLGNNKTIAKVHPATALPPVKILRRKLLLKFIEVKPSERYDELKNFIETLGIDKAENALRLACKTAKAEVDQLVRDEAAAQDQLDALWRQEVQGGDALTWAKGIAALDTARLQAEKQAIIQCERLIGEFRTIFDALRRADDEHKNCVSLYDVAVADKQREEARLADQSADLLGVLQAAQAYVAANDDTTACPVCRQGINAAALAGELTSRIEALRDLADAVQVLSTCRRALMRSQTSLEQETGKLLDLFGKLESFALANDLRADDVISLNASQATVIKTAVKASNRLDAAQLCLTGLDADMRDLKTRLATIEQTLGLKSSVKLQLERLDGNKETQVATDTVRRRLEAVLKVVEDERKKFVQGSIDELETDIRALYEAIHEGEGLSNIRIILDPKQRGSAHLIDEATDKPPQAYFSESHLDTLGLCIWLAFTKKYSPANTIIILDDVLTSVDNIHLRRFIDVIDGQARHFGHIILTTHYRLWRDKYKHHQAANTNVDFIELKEWSRDRGIIVGNDIPCLQDLRSWLDPHKFERVAVSHRAGIFLEALLDELALLYRTKVPRKASQEYTIKELLDSFSKEKKKLLKVEHLDNGTVITSILLEPLLDEIDQCAWVRNAVGCHYNQIGQMASDREVREFAERVVQLAEAVICPVNGNIPHNDKSRLYYQSAGDRCRLYPLSFKG